MGEGKFTIGRRDILRAGVLGGVALSSAGLSLLNAQADDDEGSGQVNGSGRAVAKIYQLQAAFHRAKSHQDIDLMASLWAVDATFTITPSNVTYIGREAIRTFFLTTGSFKHQRMSLVPSFKDQIRVHDDEGFLYFECHDIALEPNDPGGSAGALVTHLNNYGTVRNVNGSWLFYNMRGGSIPLSVDTIYYT